jgi:hypothetical protein
MKFFNHGVVKRCHLFLGRPIYIVPGYDTSVLYSPSHPKRTLENQSTPKYNVFSTSKYTYGPETSSGMISFRSDCLKEDKKM